MANSKEEKAMEINLAPEKMPLLKKMLVYIVDSFLVVYYHQTQEFWPGIWRKFFQNKKPQERIVELEPAATRQPQLNWVENLESEFLEDLEKRDASRNQAQSAVSRGQFFQNQDFGREEMIS